MIAISFILNLGSDHNVSMEIVAANYGDENVAAQLLSGQAQIQSWVPGDPLVEISNVDNIRIEDFLVDESEITAWLQKVPILLSLLNLLRLLQMRVQCLFNIHPDSFLQDMGLNIHIEV